jgi:hypothetical protein
MSTASLPKVAAVTADSVEIDAAVIAAGLRLEAAEVPDLMRRGEITSICETGIEEDEGRRRLTFFFRNTRLSIIVDAQGRLLDRGIVRFGDRPLPPGLRRPGG